MKEISNEAEIPVNWPEVELLGFAATELGIDDPNAEGNEGLLKAPVAPGCPWYGVSASPPDLKFCKVDETVLNMPEVELVGLLMLCDSSPPPIPWIRFAAATAEVVIGTCPSNIASRVSFAVSRTLR